LFINPTKRVKLQLIAAIVMEMEMALAMAMAMGIGTQIRWLCSCKLGN